LESNEFTGFARVCRRKSLSFWCRPEELVVVEDLVAVSSLTRSMCPCLAVANNILETSPAVLKISLSALLRAEERAPAKEVGAMKEEAIEEALAFYFGFNCKHRDEMKKEKEEKEESQGCHCGD